MSRCPVCRAPAGDPFFELLGVPVYCNVLWPTREDALRAPRGDIRLSLCGACGMIWNTSFDPSAVDYGVEYENSLHFSPVFRRYAGELAERLVADHELDGRHVIDVGCGKGDFLALLCAGGRNRGTGFDPSYGGAHDGVPWLSFVRDVYSDAHAGDPGHLVSCRHVLEHVTDPRAFAAVLRGAVLDGGVLYVEVPSGSYMLREGAIWDVIYEHCSYFTEPALARLLTEAGFGDVRVGESFGGQYLWVEAGPAGASAVVDPQANAVGELVRLAERFADAFATTVGAASTEVDRRLEVGSVALWGVGSKGVTFLNVADPGRRIDAVVDVNPRKHGRHVAGSGQRILAPDELPTEDPGTVLVMNRLYAEEIERQVRQAGLSSEVVLV